MNGKRVHITDPVDSRNLGIEMLYKPLPLLGTSTGKGADKKLFGRIYQDSEQEGDGQPVRGSHLSGQNRIHQVTKRVKELSGGQQQSVAIARAIAFNARLIIMDEPKTNLGVKEVGHLLDLLQAFPGQINGVYTGGSYLADGVADGVAAKRAGEILITTASPNSGTLDRIKRGEIHMSADQQNVMQGWIGA